MIKTSNESTKFRATSVKSYYKNDIDLNAIESLFTFNEFSQSFIKLARSFIESQSIMSHSDDVSIDQKSAKRDRDRFRKYFALIIYLSFVFNNNSIDLNFVIVFAFIFDFVVKFETIDHTSLFSICCFQTKKKRLN